MDADLESEAGFSISNSDVPSIAEHAQNDLHGGFHLPVRVIVGVWDRLLAKSVDDAIVYIKKWRVEPYRLFRRLALYACAHPQVPATYGAAISAKIDRGEFFLTGATVECWRLIKSRWKDFSLAKRKPSSRKYPKGRRGRFSGRVPTSGASRIGCRFDILGEMKRNELDIGPDAERLYKQIEKRWPAWQLRPAEQAGFHIWHGGGEGPERVLRRGTSPTFPTTNWLMKSRGGSNRTTFIERMSGRKSADIRPTGLCVPLDSVQRGSVAVLPMGDTSLLSVPFR